MTAPNLLVITTVTGKTAVANVTTSAANIVSNGTGSNQLIKINSLVVTNIDTANAIGVTAGVLRSSVTYKVASNISVPSNSALIAISKDANIFLEEGDVLTVVGTANNLQAVCSYELIG